LLFEDLFAWVEETPFRLRADGTGFVFLGNLLSSSGAVPADPRPLVDSEGDRPAPHHPDYSGGKVIRVGWVEPAGSPFIFPESTRRAKPNILSHFDQNILRVPSPQGRDRLNDRNETECWVSPAAEIMGNRL